MCPSLHPSRRLNLLLLVALIHYLNACPCGCLEHNALYQAVVSTLDDGHHHHSPAEDDNSSHEEAVAADNHHCDGCKDIVFASSRNEGASHAIAAAIGHVTSVAPSVANEVTLRSEHLKSLVAVNRGLGVCAELAVLQI